MFGAAGGFGVDTVSVPGVLRGLKYVLQTESLPAWPSMMALRIRLEMGDKMYIVVGQAGANACPEVSCSFIYIETKCIFNSICLI